MRAMDHLSTYDDDILEWSEQQAAVLRALRDARRDLPNELDLEHVAEEIEDVGRAEFFTVQSLVRQILIHLIKGISSLESASLLHWRTEVVAFHTDLLDRITPSMRARLDLGKLWSRGLRQAEADLAEHGETIADGLRALQPPALAEILAPDFDFLRTVAAIRERLQVSAPPPPS